MKKIIIGVLVIIEIFSLYMMYQSNENKNLNEVNIKDNKINKNTFAIYWDEKGTGTYTEYTKETWPGDGYMINFEKTECMSERGDKLNTNILDFMVGNNNLTITSKNTAYCKIYFSKCNGAIGTVLEDKNQVTNCPVGGMYRYQETDEVNNWICFGTTDKEECTSESGIDKYMYRIIGVTPEGELALIKETGVQENNIRIFQWNDKYNNTEEECGKDGSLCTWPDSTLFKRLNGFGGTEIGTYGDSNIFIGNSYYEYLNNDSKWLSKISNHTWKYGDTIDNGNYNGDNAYAIVNKFSNIIQAQIGLLYIHDYYYAYPGGNPGNKDIAKTSWIHITKDGNILSREWLINRKFYSSQVSAYGVYIDGEINHVDVSNYSYFYTGVRPVFYLNSNIKISNTEGSKDDPFIIN